MTVCFVDCETTGLDPDRHEIWEVGLITPVAGAEDSWNEHTWQLPVDLAKADPIALNIGRFHERRARDFEGKLMFTPLWQFAEEFVRLTRGLHLVGACVSFDADRLWRLMRAAGECPMWHYHLVDVEALAAGYLARKVHENEQAGYTDSIRPSPPWKSSELSLAVGVDPEAFDRHTALGDAQWAKAIYEAVMGAAEAVADAVDEPDESSPVVDLMAALEASLAAAKTQRPPAGEAPVAGDA